MTSESWPELVLEDWVDTRETVHMWTQVVGKVQLELRPFVNQWWEVGLVLTARGLASGLIPLEGRSFQFQFDFLEHVLHIDVSDRTQATITLEPRPVSDFYAAVMDALRRLGIEVAAASGLPGGSRDVMRAATLMLLAPKAEVLHAAPIGSRGLTPLERQAIDRSPYALDDEDVDALVAFGDDCSRMLGTLMRGASLSGEPDAPVLSVLFSDERQRPGVLYSYEWRLRDLDDPGDIVHPLGVMLVEYLGNEIMEDLQSTPGLPLWEPDAQGVVRVDVQSARYQEWPQEWRRIGRPWRDQAGVLRYGDDQPD